MKCPRYYPNGYCKKGKSGNYHRFMKLKCIATCTKVDPAFPCPTKQNPPPPPGKSKSPPAAAPAGTRDRMSTARCQSYKGMKIGCPRSSLRGKGYCCHPSIKRYCAKTCFGFKC